MREAAPFGVLSLVGEGARRVSFLEGARDGAGSIV